jgi:hypothetical protein
MILESRNSGKDRVENNNEAPSDSGRADLSRQVQQFFGARGNSSVPQDSAAYRYSSASSAASRAEFADGGVSSEPSRLAGVVDQLKQHRTRLMIDAAAPPELRLAALQELSKSGVSKLNMRGNDGQDYTLRLEREHVGAREMVHLLVAGANGKEQTVLRGVANHNGQFEPEHDLSGKPVGWYGDGAVKLRNAMAADSSDLQRQTIRGQTLESLKRRPVEMDPMDRRTDARNDNQNFSALQKDQPESRLRLDLSNQTLSLDARQQLDRAGQDGHHQSHRLLQTTAGIYLRSGMSIDADGSPRAGQIDPNGQSGTRMRYADNKSINSEVVPYMVLPSGGYQKFGIKLGDLALVRNTDNGRMAVAVFADTGPPHRTGEGSIELAREVGLNPSPTSGGTPKPSIEYLILPKTHGDPPNNEHELMARIAEQRQTFGI